MVAFLLATLVSMEDRGKVTEEQRRWWRLVARAERIQVTSQDEIILQHGRDIICYSELLAAAQPHYQAGPHLCDWRGKGWGEGQGRALLQSQS